MKGAPASFASVSAPFFAALVAVVFASFVAARPAHAAPLELAVALGPCVATPKAEIERLLRLEIGALEARAGRTLTGVRVDAAIECRGDRVLLRVFDPLTETALERPLRLARAAPEARARLVALAIVELLVTSWTDLQRPPPRDVPPAPASPEARQAAGAIAATHRGDRATAVRLYAQAAAWRGPSAFGLVPELGARLEVEGMGGFGFGLDARAGRADAEATLGRVSLESFALVPSFDFHWDRGRWGLRAAAGARVAYVRFAGKPADPERYDGESFSAPWLGPVVAAGVRARVWSRLVVTAAGEAGWVARPLGARVVGARELAVEGPWLGATLGCGWAL